MVKILVLDNYDSFVYTLNGYLQQLGAQTEVVRNDAFSEADIPSVLAKYDAVLISPGPGTPASGHQAIAEAMGATVTSAPELMHGKTSKINHQNSPIFEGLPQGFTATRYHSLAVVRETVPSELEITGQTDSGVIMSLQHKSKPIFGVQFHPESVMTEGGYMMLANWLESLGLKGAREKAATLSPRINSQS